MVTLEVTANRTASETAAGVNRIIVSSRCLGRIGAPVEGLINMVFAAVRRKSRPSHHGPG
jgi:hypothetical protein